MIRGMTCQRINTDIPRVDSEERREEPLHYDIGSPMKTDIIDENIGEDVAFLDDDPNVLRGRQFQSPTRPPATMRKKNIHVEEPATKRSIVGKMTDDENDHESSAFLFGFEKRAPENLRNEVHGFIKRGAVLVIVSVHCPRSGHVHREVRDFGDRENIHDPSRV